MPIRMYVRDRTAGEYSIWRKNPGVPIKHAWVKDGALFPFLDQHANLAADAPGTNFLWPFRDSIELKERLSLDFKTICYRALLARWLREARLPSVCAIPRSMTGGGPGRPAEVHVAFKVAGPAPALDVALSHDETGYTRLGDLVQGQEHLARLRVRASPDRHTVWLEYTTEFGARIQDTFLLTGHDAAEAGHVRLRLVEKTLMDAAAFKVG